MFYDKAKIHVKAGDGGNGCSSFRREKYVPDGGPDGGDGGRGGSVILRAEKGLRTLVDFHYKSHFKAGRGQHGMGKKKHGKSGEKLVIYVPVGTIVYDAATDGELLADLVNDGQEIVVAQGGRGGRGNTHFAGPRNKAPTMAEKGEPGEECWLKLELKLIADVGLVGFPNAGKSTLISQISAARPKIADYPFTTLTPNLGVVSLEEGRSFVVADIPGIIKGAHSGAGLGHRFLRHTERTRVLVYVLDAAGMEGRDPAQDFYVLNSELVLYDKALVKKPQIIVANKMDLPGAEENLRRLKEELGGKYEIFPASALTGNGLQPFLHCLAAILARLSKPCPVEESAYHRTARVDTGPPFSISMTNGCYVVEGRTLEKIVAMTNFENQEALTRLQNHFKRSGLEKALEHAGAKDGCTVRIGKYEFIYNKEKEALK